MGMQFGPTFWGLVALGLAAALAYGFAFLDRPHTLLRAVVKTSFMAALTAAFALAGAHPLLILALAAAAAGDFFLAFDKKWLLPFGILSFLVAQLAYLAIFLALWIFSGDNAPLWPRWIMMGAIVAAAVVFLVVTAPRLRWMALAVVPYAIAITAMAAAAMWLPWAGWPVMVGVVSFLISDFVLAAELFLLAGDATARRVTGPVVWWTYAAAQILIVAGVTVLSRQMV